MPLENETDVAVLEPVTDAPVTDTQVDAPAVEDESTVENEGVTTQATVETEVVETPKPKVETFDKVVVGWAKENGFKDEDIEAFADSGQLRNALVAMDRTRVKGKEKPVVEQAKPEPKPEPQASIEGKTPRYKIAKRDEWAPEVADEFDAMSEHYAAQVDSLRAELQQSVGKVGGAVVGQNTLVRIGQFDQFLKTQKGYEEIFGTDEDSLEMDPESATYKARDEVFTQAEELAASLKAEGKPVPKWSKLCQRALWMLHGDKVESAAAEKLRKEIAERKEQRSPKPGGQTKPRVSDDPDDEAKQAIRDFHARVNSRSS